MPTSHDVLMEVATGLRSGFGREVGGFRLGTLLSTGTRTTVWLADDGTSADQVVVKVLADRWASSPVLSREFLGRAERHQRLATDAMLGIRHVGRQPDGRPYSVLAWAQRGSLQHRLSGGPLGLDDVIDTGIALCGSLGSLHDRGEPHGRLVPANVMFLTSGSDAVRLVLTDPGISPTDPVEPGGLPEAALSAEADLLAVGQLLEQMATGRIRVSEGEDPGMLHATGGRPANWRPRTGHPGLDRLLSWARLGDPRRGISSCAELAEALRGLREGVVPRRRVLAGIHRHRNPPARRQSAPPLPPPLPVATDPPPSEPSRPPPIEPRPPASSTPPDQQIRPDLSVSPAAPTRPDVPGNRPRSPVAYRWLLAVPAVALLTLVALASARMVVGLRDVPTQSVDLTSAGLTAHLPVTGSLTLQRTTWIVGDDLTRATGVTVREGPTGDAMSDGAASKHSLVFLGTVRTDQVGEADLAKLTGPSECTEVQTSAWARADSSGTPLRAVLAESRSCASGTWFDEAVVVGAEPGVVVYVVVRGGGRELLLDTVESLRATDR
ncbi:MAG: hypothetical protein ACRCYQ_10250 [Nocardioides sp.]